MTWEEKLQALKGLAPAWLVMSEPGSWSVHWDGVERAGDGLLRSAGACGATPKAAVEETWAAVVGLPSDRYLAVSRGGFRLYFRWSGFMWTKATPRAGTGS